VLIKGRGGFTAIPASRPLTRLNYFDGKFLRASDLQGEQAYERLLVALANQGGGGGVVHGFDATQPGGDELMVGPGLAFDFEGRPLLLPQEVAVDVGALIEASRAPDGAPAFGGGIGSAAFGDCVTAPLEGPSAVIQGIEFYLVTIGPAEAYCGEEDVFGKLCEDACVTRAERPFIVEGVTIRAVPLPSLGPLITSRAVSLTRTHLRSRVASAYFANEAAKFGSLISRAGLGADAWCLGAGPAGGRDVPIAILARAGATTMFVDAWTARRERIEPPPRQYWAWRMAMRPWGVFLAQVLQFQCQLRDLFQGGDGTNVDIDPCGDVRTAARAANDALSRLIAYHAAVSSRLVQLNLVADIGALPEIPQGAAGLKSLQDSLAAAGVPIFPEPANRVLIRGGIVELPSAGYLPVVARSPQTVNDQIRRLLGEGLDLRFCVVRPDYVPHALEESQHMERISLLQGLDDKNNLPRVDILVPDGEILHRLSETPGRLFQGEIRLGGLTGPITDGGPETKITVQGAGRSDLLDSGGATIDFAGASSPRQIVGLVRFLSRLITEGSATRTAVRPSAPPPTARVVDASLFHNLGVAAAAADRHLVQLRGRAAEVRDPFRLAEDSRIAAIVATARCEKNPFDLRPGEITPVSLQILGAAPDSTTRLSDLNAFGRFSLESLTPRPDGPTARGVLTLLTVQQSFDTTGPTPPSQSTLTLEVVLRLRRNPDGSFTGTLELSKRPTPVDDVAGLRYRVTVDWGPDATRKVEARLDVGDSKESLSDAVFLENPGVIQPAEAHHLLASRAIQVIAANLNDPKFADVVESRLFPPAPPSKSALEILARLDWVLFRRRREAVCALDAPPPPPPPIARQYRVYQANLTSPEAFAAFREELLAGSSMAQWNLALIDVVDYPGGLGSLATDPAAFRIDWTSPGPGNTVGVAAIGTVSGPAADDGDDLALARLNSLLATLAPIEDLAIPTGSGPDILARIAPDFDLTGVDGVIVIATANRVVVKTECQSVYWLNPFPYSDVRKSLEAGDLGNLIERPDGDARRITLKLGSVNFEAGSATVLGDASPVKELWNKVSQDGEPSTAVVFSASDGGGSAPSPLHADRAKAIAAMLGHDVDVSRITIQAMPPGDCPVVTLVTPNTTCHQVFAVLPNSDQFIKINEFLANGKFTSLVRLAQPVELGLALFVPGADRVIDRDLKPLADVFPGPLAAASISVWTRMGDSRVEPVEARRAQAAALARIVGGDPIPPAILVETENDLAIDCPHLTLLVLQPRR
jgi:hypothetical protein